MDPKTTRFSNSSILDFVLVGLDEIINKPENTTMKNNKKTEVVNDLDVLNHILNGKPFKDSTLDGLFGLLTNNTPETILDEMNKLDSLDEILAELNNAEILPDDLYRKFTKSIAKKTNTLKQKYNDFLLHNDTKPFTQKLPVSTPSRLESLNALYKQYINCLFKAGQVTGNNINLNKKLKLPDLVLDNLENNHNYSTLNYADDISVKVIIID